MENLPSELILEIFLLSAPTMASTTNGMNTLALVCHRWQDIALGNHRLWTSLVIELTSIDQAVRWERRLTQYLLRSGNLPLSIMVECNYRPRSKPNVLSEAFFATRICLVMRKLVAHADRWVSFHLNIENGMRRDMWLDMNSLLSVTMPKINQLGLAGAPFLAAPKFHAPALQQVTLFNVEVEGGGFLSFPQATHLSIYSDKDKMLTLGKTIAAASTSLVHLTLSIWEWDETDTLSGTFPSLTILSLLGGCQLQPGLFENFIAPALEELEINLWQINDLRELASCHGIPFARINRISFGWTAADDLHEVFTVLVGMLKSCSSLQLLDMDPSASIQCEITCLLVLLSHLEDVEGGTFQFSINDITECIPSGPERREIHDQLAEKFGLVDDDGLVHRDDYLEAMDLWF